MIASAMRPGLVQAGREKQYDHKGPKAVGGEMASLTMAAAHRPAPTASACRNCLFLSQATDDALSALALRCRSLPEGFRISLSLQRVSQHTMSALPSNFTIDLSMIAFG